MGLLKVGLRRVLGLRVLVAGKFVGGSMMVLAPSAQPPAVEGCQVCFWLAMVDEGMDP